MPFEHLESALNDTYRRELSDLASHQGTSEIEILRRLIDRAYEADLLAHLDTAEKPGTLPPPTG
jgi:hypothetical protein